MEALNWLKGIDLSTIKDWIHTAIMIFGIIMTIRSIFFKTKSRFALYIAKFISIVESDSNLTGAEKMNMVVGWVKNMIPRIFTILISDKVIEAAAQSVFDDMVTYRDNYIKNKTNLDTKAMIQLVKDLDDPQSNINTGGD